MNDFATNVPVQKSECLKWTFCNGQTGICGGCALPGPWVSRACSSPGHGRTVLVSPQTESAEKPPSVNSFAFEIFSFSPETARACCSLRVCRHTVLLLQRFLVEKFTLAPL